MSSPVCLCMWKKYGYGCRTEVADNISVNAGDAPHIKHCLMFLAISNVLEGDFRNHSKPSY